MDGREKKKEGGKGPHLHGGLVGVVHVGQAILDQLASKLHKEISLEAMKSMQSMEREEFIEERYY